MGLLDIVRSGVAIANKVTAPLQSVLTFERYLGSDGEGERQYDTPIRLRAIIEEKQRSLRTASGELSMSSATITFLDVPALVAATPEVRDSQGNIITRAGALNDNDRITLPDGKVQPILNIGGFVDAGTGNPVATEVYLG